MGDRVTGAARLGRDVATSLDEARVARGGAERVRERLLARAMPRVRQKWRVRRTFAAGAVGLLAVAAALALVFGRVSRETKPLTFVVGGAEGDSERGVVGAFIAAPQGADLPLAFSDGSSVRLAPTARARVASLASSGARVLIESGTLSVHVVHRERTRWEPTRWEPTRWEIAAGPFEVHVTGTTFDVAWDPATEALVVKLSEGSVVVTGCALEGGRRVGAGDELRTTCTKSTKSTTANPAADANPDAKATGSHDGDGIAAHALPEALPEASAEVPAAAPNAEASPRPNKHHDKHAEARDEDVVNVVALARRGAHTDAITAAEGHGFAKTCDALSAAELLILADAGRYAGRFDRANEALTAVRARFGGTDAAASAAFELGRIAFDVKREFAAAGDWFDTYLQERPAGSLAREALGRGLEARSRAGDSARTQALAARYLAAYPDGPHAQLARRLGGPGEAGP